MLGHGRGSNPRMAHMKLEIDLKSMKCNYKECWHYYEGECQDEEARKNCQDIALAVLCVSEGEDGVQRRSDM